ncbi:PREDICTED: putative pyridoxal kinase, partial [Priapulus caudatus]|uniref:pyridoxal kinase n=1 Tax=Priapulus caudatus TaxID=37621 RepID=A0ABM1F743_PRICU
ELGEMLEGLVLNDIHHYTHVLTVVDIIKTLIKINPNLIYVCDRVMGDDGKMYGPKEPLPIYRDHLIPLAHILTPNQFE